VSDPIDLAQERDDILREEAIARRPRVPQAAEGRRICVQCDGLVHPRRAALGYSTCIDCQERIEHRARQ
jgi:RNA polymerase-binding transcription factor DksA